MIKVSHFSTALVLCALVAAWPATLSAQTTPAEPAATTQEARTPIDEFSKQLEDFKKTIPDLTKKIGDSAAAIDQLGDAEKTRAELEQLRTSVAAALSAVSDNGALSQLGQRALAHAQDKLKALSQDSRFKPEERQFLADQWRKLKDETERATEELGSARREFAELLRVLQVNEDFVGELMQLRQAQKALDIIRQLTRDMREASASLKKLIGAIRSPGV